MAVRPGGGRPRRWIGTAAVVALLAGAGLYGALHNSPNSPPAPTESAVPPAISQHALHKPILGITGKWELFGRGADSVVRVQLAKGLITRTAVPLLASNGPVSFLVTNDRAIIRPLDRVEGYFVPDSGRAQKLTGAMGFYGPFLPGSNPNTVWIPDERNPRTSMLLVTADGRSAHHVIRLPNRISGFAAPDGNGYALASTSRGVFDLRPGEARWITSDALIAAGPTGWLAAACNHRPECRLIVIDRGTGKHHSVGTFPESTAVGTISPAGSLDGIVSADGAAAAFITTGDQRAALHLLSLRTGIDTVIGIPLDIGAIEPGTTVWSPDSRWLFVAGADGRVYAVDAQSGSVHYLDQIPPVVQLAIRTTAAA